MRRGTFWDCTEARHLGDRKNHRDIACFTATIIETILNINMIKMLTLDKGQIKTTVYGLVVHKFTTTAYRTIPLEKSISLWTLCQRSLNTVPSDDRHGEGKKFSWCRES